MCSLKEKVEGLERAEIETALSRTGGVKARAAKMLGITERMIGYKIKKYGIKRIEGKVSEQKDTVLTIQNRLQKEEK